jgi:DNA-binding response OmpR family regulator
MASSSSVPRVILMDDDAQVLKAVGRLLAAMGLDDVRTPSCAAARHAAAQVREFDLIVADRTLGDGDGVACAVELNDLYGCATLIYSAQTRPAGTMNGVDFWVRKPGECGDLDYAVRTFLGRRGSSL